MTKELDLIISKSEFDSNNFNFSVEEFTDFLLQEGATVISNDFFYSDKNFISANFEPENNYLNFTIHVFDNLDENKFMLKLLSNYNVIFKSSFKKIPDIDWVISYQSTYKPIYISNRIWVGSSWHKAPKKIANTQLLNIFIDPGLAFGTGSHPTTRLCLESLCDISKNYKDGSLLDVGCGSGILSIAARKLGFKFSTAVDVDNQALKITKENMQKNNVSIKKCSFHNNINDVKGQFDLIISNILYSTLSELAFLITKKLKKNGSLILSGILDSQMHSIRQKYLKVSENRIVLKQISSEKDWVCLAHFGY